MGNTKKILKPESVTVSKNYVSLSAFLKLSDETFPKTIMEIPTVWLIKGVPEFEEYPKLRLLERPNFGPSGSENRVFFVATVKTAVEANTFIKLGSYCSNNTHEVLWPKMLKEVQCINPEAKLDNHGGGVIHDDPAGKAIWVVCNSGNFTAADPNEVIELLRKGLPNDYSGYTVTAKVTVTGEKAEGKIP